MSPTQNSAGTERDLKLGVRRTGFGDIESTRNRSFRKKCIIIITTWEFMRGIKKELYKVERLKNPEIVPKSIIN